MTTDNLTDTEINLRLAEALGVDLTAQTEEEIAQAILDACTAFHSQGRYIRYEWNGRVEEFRGIHTYLLDNYRAFGEHLWTNRHGQPWQADIEAHVAAYRRTPPNWAGDLTTAFALAFQLKLFHHQNKPHLILCQTSLYDTMLWEVCRVGPHNALFMFTCDERASRAIALAALRTLEEAKDER